MSDCCHDPNIKSSTYCDWCTNCGWQYDYINNVESHVENNKEQNHE